jgi:hypothetical protein
MPVIIANFRHVADGLREGQFATGERERAASLGGSLSCLTRNSIDKFSINMIFACGLPGCIAFGI